MIDRSPARWKGREDQPGSEHARWHHVINAGRAEPVASIIGFASDEGVRRNQGRLGAAEGPAALRGMLADLADPGVPLVDLGDVVVEDGNLEAGQNRLASEVGAVLDRGCTPIVLGGGHEVAYGSAGGWLRRPETWGVLNLDAHLDLRQAPRPTSGTPFRQLADELGETGRPFHYSVIGLSRPSNTRALIETADRLGVCVLHDIDTDVRTAVHAAEELLGRVDRVHLTLDLDVLPASVAPGVSAPAALGVAPGVVLSVLRAVAGSGKLGLFEVAELNPLFDVDARTARIAARCVDEVVRSLG